MSENIYDMNASFLIKIEKSFLSIICNQFILPPQIPHHPQHTKTLLFSTPQLDHVKHQVWFRPSCLDIM